MDVKFYRLGFNKPVADASYRAIAFENEGDNGNVVFAKVDSSIANVSNGEIKVIPPTYYICAAGIEYKVADADTLTKIFNEFEDLVDTSHIGDQYTNVKSVHYWIQEAMKKVDVTAEAVYRVIDASNKIYDPSEGVRYQIERSADGIDVSIKKREGNDVSSLLFGVDLDKIYLPTGVQRTEKIGGCDAVDEPVTEGVGWSVKELLEYYLLKEKFPNPVPTQGSGSFTAYQINITGYPDTNLTNNYIRVKKVGSNSYTKINSGNLVEIGSDVSISGISGTLRCSSTGDWATSKSCTPASITGMKFGYSVYAYNDEHNQTIDTEPNHKIPGEVNTATSIINEATNATAQYSVIADTLTGSVTLKVKNSNGTSTAKSSALNDNAYELDKYDTYKIVEGENKFILTVTHDASATRTLSNTAIAGISDKWYLSNKKHIGDTSVVHVNATSFTNVKHPTINQYPESSVTYTGVYPIYTNGTESNGIGDPESVFRWADNGGGTWHGHESTSIHYTKLALQNPNTNATIYIGTGNFSGDDEMNKPIIFIPANLGLKIETGENAKVAAATISAGKITGFSEGSLYFDSSSLVQINGIDYHMYEIVKNSYGLSGNTCLKVELKKNN